MDSDGNPGIAGWVRIVPVVAVEVVPFVAVEVGNAELEAIEVDPVDCCEVGSIVASVFSIQFNVPRA